MKGIFIGKMNYKESLEKVLKEEKDTKSKKKD